MVTKSLHRMLQRGGCSARASAHNLFAGLLWVQCSPCSFWRVETLSTEEMVIFAERNEVSDSLIATIGEESNLLTLARAERVLFDGKHINQWKT